MEQHSSRLAVLFSLFRLPVRQKGPHMLRVKAGGETLLLEFEGRDEVYFDCAAHMKLDPHGRSHQYERDGIVLQIDYSRVRATLEVRYPIEQTNGAFVRGKFVCVGGIWLPDTK